MKAIKSLILQENDWVRERERYLINCYAWIIAYRKWRGKKKKTIRKNKLKPWTKTEISAELEKIEQETWSNFTFVHLFFFKLKKSIFV